VRRHKRKGFTLVELLMVIGIMGLIGSVATMGYYAAVRGMTDNGVRQDVVSFLRAAQQRALADNTPTVVFMYNETLRAESADGMKAAVANGVLVAVRMAGRISYIGSGNVIVDEFADWDKSYDVGGQTGNATPLRLYRLVAQSASELMNISQCRSYVYPFVEENVKWMTDPLLEVSEYLSVLKNDSAFALNADDKSIQFPSASDFNGVQFHGFARPFGFKVKSGNSTWMVGDAYGMEIGTLRLPNDYKLGTSSSESTKDGETEDVGNILFDPATVSPDTCDFNTSVNVTIRCRRPNGTYERVAAITQNDLKDDQQQ